MTRNQRLTAIFACFNTLYFRGKLPANTRFNTMTGADDPIGRYVCAKNIDDVDLIEIAADYRGTRLTLADVVLHEMIHQWIHHSYKGNDWLYERCHHSKQFKRHYNRIKARGGFSKAAVKDHEKRIFLGKETV